MFAVTNDQDGYNIERKQKLIEQSDADCYNWDSLIVSWYKFLWSVFNKLRKFFPMKYF